jgi:hypothetical protein
MNTLNWERLYILRALSFDSTFVLDKYVPLEIKKILCDFSKHLSFDILKKEESVENTPGQLLSNVYSEYGIALIRCLLINFYLIYSKNELEKKLSPFIKKFCNDIKENEQYIPLVLNELNQYAHAPFEALEKFIDILINEIGKFKGQYNYILYNNDFSFDFKFIVFKQLVEKKENLDLLLEFLAGMVNSDRKYDFHTILFPLILEYAKTEYEGFNFAFNIVDPKNETVC